MFKDIENGPGEWVFKNALLKDEEYTNLIKNKIPAYAINKHEYGSNTDFLENLFLTLRYTTQEYLTNKNKPIQKRSYYVNQQIEALEALPQHLLVGCRLDHLEHLRDEQEKINECKLNGLALY